MNLALSQAQTIALFSRISVILADRIENYIFSDFVDEMVLVEQKISRGFQKYQTHGSSKKYVNKQTFVTLLSYNSLYMILV